MAAMVSLKPQQYPTVDVLQRLDFRDRNVLIDLVNTRPREAQFDNLRADLGNEASVTGATGRGQLRFDSVLLANRRAHDIDEAHIRTRQERQSPNDPLNAVLQSVPVEHGCQPPLQVLRSRFGGE